MRARAIHVALLFSCLSPCLVGRAAAADRPLAGDLLRLKDPSNPAGRRFVFRAARDPGVGTDVGDPRVSGATLEVAGSAAGDGSTGALDLPAASWSGLGNPAGSRGYRYVDRSGAMRRVIVRTGARGSIVATGRGAAWPYAIDGPQGPIKVRLTIGDRLFCATFTRYAKNGGGRVVARNAPAPSTCTVATSVCGNGVAEGREECDDGNTAGGDGCSAACELQDASALCAGVPTASSAALRAVLVASGLDGPVHVTAAPLDPNRLFVVEQPGRIRIVADGALLPQPFLAIEDLVGCCNERGLLSVAFHPQYATNGRFFVYYTDDDTGDIVIARYQVSANADVADATSGRILLTIPHREFTNHNGGQLAFGPDGYLYAGTGDGGDSHDSLENGQDTTSLLGKMLRLDVDVDGPPHYAVPATNPFAGATPGRDEIWASGLRNPWRFAFDRGTGDLYIGDVGQNLREEVDVQPAASAGGENYGWDVFEGTSCHEPDPAPVCPEPPTGFTMPVVEYDHGGDRCSVTGGHVYRGCRMPDLRGTYFYSDYCVPFFRTFRGVSGGAAQEAGTRTAELATPALALEHIITFGEDARGELYFGDQNGGRVFRIEPAS